MKFHESVFLPIQNSAVNFLEFPDVGVDFHASLAGLKFLGSYPAAGEHSEIRRRDAEASWKAADEWITDVRRQIRN